jgi:hypothetical protein
VACSGAEFRDSGYATAAFAAASLAAALIATALVSRAGAELRAAEQAMTRERQGLLLDGALTKAAIAVMAEPGSPRLAWRAEIDGQAVDLLAEPEALKLETGAAADLLEPEDFARLGVADAERTRASLRAMSSVGSLDPQALRRAGGADGWAACAASLVSPFGSPTRTAGQKARPPKPGAVGWRVGELWRLRARSGDGWSDDRIVRFGGDGSRPAATVWRRFSRDAVTGYDCEELLWGGRR